jgi:hypothetical protein
MKKAVFAGAVALAMMGSLLVSEKGFGPAAASAQEIIVTEGKIARLKRALNLTAEQRPHWRPVEATLRAIIRNRQQTADTSENGLVHRVRSRVSGYAVQASSLQQLSSVAGPLIASLNENQRRNGMAVIRSMGVASLY